MGNNIRRTFFLSTGRYYVYVSVQRKKRAGFEIHGLERDLSIIFICNTAVLTIVQTLFEHGFGEDLKCTIFFCRSSPEVIQLNICV